MAWMVKTGKRDAEAVISDHVAANILHNRIVTATQLLINWHLKIEEK
jgi:hypothetical protein